MDVMIDFKNRALDTPQVIDHVHYLFEGKESLIQGFNTFLPPGYRMPVGCRSDPSFVWIASAKRAPDESSHTFEEHVFDNRPGEYESHSDPEEDIFDHYSAEDESDDDADNERSEECSEDLFCDDSEDDKIRRSKPNFEYIITNHKHKPVEK